jgi:DNA-3-methyladenine glycosylase II
VTEFSPLEFLCQRDSVLARVIESIGDYSIETHGDPFESLLKSIIYQQLSGKAANAIYKRLLDHYGGRVPTPDRILATREEIFRINIGLSFKKIEYLRDLSLRVSSGTLNLHLLPGMTDEEVIDELVKVKGIGRWTAEMFLIFCLKRPDVMPLGDLGIRKAIKNLYNLPQIPNPGRILEISSLWKPYRSIAAWYLWKSLANFDSIG